MDLKIFDVEHGQCALLTCDDGKRIMIDVGHNGDSGWQPGTYLEHQGVYFIDLLAVTNFDSDHVSGLGNLTEHVSIGALLRNRDVTPDQLRAIKKKTGGMSNSIMMLTTMMESTYTAVSTGPFIAAGLQYEVYWHDYPTFTDTNNLSMVLFLECHGIGVMFPGDLEDAGWTKMLERPDFRNALRKTSVLVASHHGRISGCCADIFDRTLCNPFYVVISDKGIEHDTQITTNFYNAAARGGPFRGKTRKVLTTRNDGRIGFTFNVGPSWDTY